MAQHPTTPNRFTPRRPSTKAATAASRNRATLRNWQPVCDGCHAHTSADGWHAASDGNQYCAACSRQAAAG